MLLRYGVVGVALLRQGASKGGLLGHEKVLSGRRWSSCDVLGAEMRMKNKSVGPVNYAL